MKTVLALSRGERIALVVGGVLRQAVHDAGATGILLLDAHSPEGRLAREWAEAALGVGSVTVLHGETPAAPPAGCGGAGDGIISLAERERALARTLAQRAGTLLAHPANKTVLLLGSTVPPEPLLPLGDLYASQVAELAGGWSGPDEVQRIAARLGGVAALDVVLERMFEGRRCAEEATAHLPADAAAELCNGLDGRRFWRRRVGLVPKLGGRTLGIDILA